jgi:hypothetical protein
MLSVMFDVVTTLMCICEALTQLICFATTVVVGAVTLQAMDHTMDRYKVSEMLCMLCGSLQPESGVCTHSACPSNNISSDTTVTAGGTAGGGGAACRSTSTGSDTTALSRYDIKSNVTAYASFEGIAYVAL